MVKNMVSVELGSSQSLLQDSVSAGVKGMSSAPTLKGLRGLSKKMHEAFQVHALWILSTQSS